MRGRRTGGRWRRCEPGHAMPKACMCLPTRSCSLSCAPATPTDFGLYAIVTCTKQSIIGQQQDRADSTPSVTASTALIRTVVHVCRGQPCGPGESAYPRSLTTKVLPPPQVSMLLRFSVPLLSRPPVHIKTYIYTYIYLHIVYT